MSTRLCIVLTILTASEIASAQLAISPSTGPWMLGTPAQNGIPEICGYGQTPSEAVQSWIDQILPYNPIVRPESFSCAPIDWSIIDLTFDDINWHTCIPESNKVQGGTPNHAPVCTIQHTQSSGGGFESDNLIRHLECPDGTIYDLASDGQVICLVRLDDTCHIGDPVSPATGMVFEEELDYRSGGANPLELRRYYNGARYYAPSYLPRGTRTGGFTNHWSHNYGSRIYVDTLNQGVASTAVRPDGALWHFDASGNEVLNHSGTGGAAHAEHLSDGTWRLTLSNDDVETYNTAGRLTSITTRAGFSTTVSYSGTQITVADAFGRSLTFALDSDGRIETVTDPGGGVIAYSYSGDSLNNTEVLDSVTYPDSKVRSYTYATSAGRLRLASVIDESGQTYSSFSYDNSGFVTSSEHAGGADHHSFAYPTRYTANQHPVTTVTDPLGQVRTYTMNSAGGVYRVASTTGGPCASCGIIASRQYDANGNLSRTVDFNGNQTAYSYDLTRNLETSRTEALFSAHERTIITTWHSTYRLPISIAEPNRTTTYTYDASGNVLTRTIEDTSPSSEGTRTWTYTYNSVGQVLTEDGPRTDVADTTTYTYYTCSTGFACGQLHTITNALGQVTTFNTYNAHGQPLTISDPNSVVTTFTYDARQRLTSRQVEIEATSFTYWPAGQLKRVTMPNGSYLQYGYDAAHRLTSISDGEGNRIEYVLDAAGNRTSETAYDPTNVLSYTRSQVFNTLGQLWKQVGSAGTAAVTTSFTYDGNGNATNITAPLSRSTSNQYDEFNRLALLTDPNSGTTAFDYDTDDNLTSVTDPRGLTTTYTYNGFGDRISQTSPDTGLTTTTYDAASNARTQTDARGVAGTFNYDALNRLTSIVFPDQTVSFGYDSGVNGVGRLTSASDTAHSMAWSYDGLGRVTTKTQTHGGVTKTVAYAYTNGNLSSLTTPSGQTITYAYAEGRISGIAVNGTTLLSSALYEPFGPIRQWTWGNSTLAVRTHDEDRNVLQVDSGGELYTYAYDDAFRISSIENASDDGLSWNYNYDLMDHLTDATSSESSLSWFYDANGNRAFEAGDSSAEFTVSETSNRFMSISGSRLNVYGYDNAGNVVSETNPGRPVSLPSATTTSYFYNALSQRVAKTVGSVVTYFVYDEAGHLLGEYGGSGALIQETVWMADTPVATLRPRTGGGVDIYYVHTDHLNTPRKITRPADNALLWRWDVAPFGAALPDENPEGAGTFRYNLRFAGQYYDTESGLHYNYFREYDPAVGRYVESDPIGLKGGINTYGYANQDPVDLADPFGLNPYIWPILKPILENTLPKTDDCKTSEWNYCRARCGPARVLGCYVSLSWKLKGIRGGEPIRSEQRTVNCNCEELSCPGPGPKKKGSRSTYDTSLPLPLFPWWELIPVL